MAAEPSRIVSLEPSITSILAALGQERRLVAVSDYCERLVEVGDLPRVPSTWSAEPDRIIALKPDLVIASVPFRAEGITALLQAGLNVLCLYPRRLIDVYTHISWLAGLTGVPARAAQVVEQMQIEFQTIQVQTGPFTRCRVYVEMWPKPAMSSPLWVAELVEIAGGVFVPEQPGRIVTTEEIQAADPEVIIVAWAGVSEPKLESVTARPGWQQVAAVQRGQVFAVEEIYLNAPGPNLRQGARLLAGIIGQITQN